MKYARIVDGVVAEVFVPPDGFELEDCFTAEIVAQFEPCPEQVEQRWTKDLDGIFHEPEPEPVPPIPQPPSE